MKRAPVADSNVGGLSQFVPQPLDHRVEKEHHLAKFKITSPYIETEAVEADDFYLKDGYVIFTRTIGGVSTENVFLVAAASLESVHREDE